MLLIFASKTQQLDTMPEHKAFSSSIKEAILFWRNGWQQCLNIFIHYPSCLSDFSHAAVITDKHHLCQEIWPGFHQRFLPKCPLPPFFVKVYMGIRNQKSGDQFFVIADHQNMKEGAVVSAAL